MTKTSLVVFGLVLLITASVAAFLWFDYREYSPKPLPGNEAGRASSETSAEKHQRAAEVQRVPPVTDHRPKVYRCDGPRGTVYQDHPCEDGIKPGEIAGGTLSVVPAGPKLQPREHKEVTASKPREPVALSTAAESHRQVRCDQLEQIAKSIDEAARRGGTAHYMDELRNQKVSVQDEMWEIGC